MNFFKLGLKIYTCQGEELSYPHLLEPRLIQSSSSQLGIISFPHPPVDSWEHLEIFLVVKTRGRESCCWHLVGRDQGHY